MSNKKISALTSATTPLAGTETLPVVQGGATKQVSVANLTAGRSLSASNVTVTGLTASKPVFTDGSSVLTSSGTMPTNQGGTGLTSFTAAGVMYATSTSALSTASGVTTDGTNLGVGVTVPTGYKLDVRSSSNSVALFYQTGAANNTDIYVDNVNAAGNFLISRRSNGEAWFYTSSTNPIVMYTQGAERLNVQSDGNIKFTTGNLVQGTAAKGVNFTANTPAAGMTSQLLNWYEDGTWTPNQGAGLTVVGAFSSTGKYTRIGREVRISGTVTGATSIAVVAAGIITTNLPFTVVTAGHGNATNVAVNASSIIICTSTNVTSAGAITATGTITFSATYFV